MLKSMLAWLSVALALVAAPAGAQVNPNPNPISGLPIAPFVNPQTDYGVGVVQRLNAGGLPYFATVRVPLSTLVGPAGQNGTNGAAATFSTITVNTLAPGSQATAALGGAAPNYTLTLGIPQGQAGTGNVSSSGTPTAGSIPIFASYSGGIATVANATASQIRSAAGAAASGSNGDITALTGLTTALPLTEGGTGATTASAARSGLGAAASGANSDITALSGLTTALSVGQGGTGATSASGARTSLGAAASGANTDITSLSSPALGAATATTQAAGTANTAVATTGFVATAVGGASGGSGFPSAFTTKSANYTVATADKNTLFTLTGSFTLSLPSASSFGAGNGIYLSKTDGSGAWAVTPASGTIDGLSAIGVYQERFALVSDGTNWRSVNRPKGWIPILTQTVSTTVASVNFTTGFGDTELRDFEFTAEQASFSAGDSLLGRVNKGSGYLTTGYSGAYVADSGGSVLVSQTNTGYDFGVGINVGVLSAYIVLQNVSVSGSTMGRYSSGGVSGYVNSGITKQKTAGAVTGFQFALSGGSNFTSGFFRQSAYRP